MGIPYATDAMVNARPLCEGCLVKTDHCWCRFSCYHYTVHLQKASQRRGRAAGFEPIPVEAVGEEAMIACYPISAQSGLLTDDYA
jgi:hypothetical protein